MSVFADPDELEQLAGRVAGMAERVREEATDFLGRVGGVEWQSSAAAQYRLRCRRVYQQLLGDAGDLDEAARALRTHAGRVRTRQEQIDALVTQARDLAVDGAVWTALQVEQARREILAARDELVADVRDLLGEVSGLVGDTLRSARDRVSDGVSSTRDAVADGYNRLKDRVT
jgi:uncharacterized protein YukE